MCDYSLERVASRPAVAADRLVSTNFTGTSTRGFAGAGDLNTAVCLRPGTEIAFDSEPRFDDWVTYKVADESVVNDAVSVEHGSIEYQSDGGVWRINAVVLDRTEPAVVPDSPCDAEGAELQAS